MYTYMYTCMCICIIIYTCVCVMRLPAPSTCVHISRSQLRMHISSFTLTNRGPCTLHREDSPAEASMGQACQGAYMLNRYPRIPGTQPQENE